MAQLKTGQVVLKNVRLSYPKLFKPEAFAKGEGKAAYSASFILAKNTKEGMDNINRLTAAVNAVKADKWGDDIPKIKSDKVFFTDGDAEDQDKEEYFNCLIVRGRNYNRPTVVNADKTPLTEEDNVLYAGCWVDAIVSVWAQDNQWGKRINCTVELVRFRKDGEAFGSTPMSADVLDELEEFLDDDAPSTDDAVAGLM